MSRRMATRAAAALTTAGLAAAISVAPASADTTRNDSAGHTVLALTNKVAKSITAGCGDGGPVFFNPVGSASGTFTRAGVKVDLPVTALVTSDTGNVRIVHDGSGFTLANSCYQVTFTDFYVQDLGSGQSTSGFDVVVRNFDDAGDDGTPRVSTFSLDLTNAAVTVKGKSTKVRGADLDLAEQGAEQFNRLAGDASGSAGPFHPGDQIGKARSTYRNPA